MINILFEDDDIIAVNKTEGLASIPERDRDKECLQTMLSQRSGHKLFIVHRIDKEVSGVILFAKNATAHQLLNDQFSSRNVRKNYLALVNGVIEDPRGVIDKPIRQFGSGRMGIDLARGKASITEFQVQERFKSYTLIQVNPLSGRRHQIRVHLYCIGHPIAGDVRYGNKSESGKFSRLMLHAHRIAFRSPSNQDVVIVAPLPESFQLALKSIRGS